MGVPNLLSLNVSRTAAANDTTLSSLAAASKLESLEAGSHSFTAYPPQETRITDAGLQSLAGLTHLKMLDLTGARITDHGLQMLAGLEDLESLSLGGTSITDEGLQHLVSLRKLTSLDLRGTSVTDDGLQKLEALPNLQRLSIPETGITPDGVARLKEFPALFSLALDSRQVSKETVSDHSKLRVLWLVGRHPEAATLAALPNLTVLGLEGTQRLTIEAGSLNSVRTLVLSGVSYNVTDGVLAWLDGIESLRMVEFRRGWLPDGGIDTTVRVHLTPQQLERLRIKFPEAKIDADVGESQPGE